jgi:hypothetical protein
MMTTSWFDGPLSKANINGQSLCKCGGKESHSLVSDEGIKIRMCDDCFIAHCKLSFEDQIKIFRR